MEIPSCNQPGNANPHIHLDIVKHLPENLQNSGSLNGDSHLKSMICGHYQMTIVKNSDQILWRIVIK